MGSILGQIAFSGVRLDIARARAVLSDGSAHGADHAVARQDPATYLAYRNSLVGAGASGVVALVDGALHGADDLARTLHLNRGTGPGRLMAHAWERWNNLTPAKLTGDFSSVIYEPETCRAHLLRDHIGTRPLYWHWDKGRLSFATFLRDLLLLLPNNIALDGGSIVNFLHNPVTIGSSTFYEGVRAVEAGHIVSIDASGPRVNRWWQTEDVPNVRFTNRESYVNAFRALTDQAVINRLPDSGPVGAHLSGGIDSTVVAIIAQEKLTQKTSALSFVYSWSPEISIESPEIAADDERRRIEDICREKGMTPRYGSLTGADIYKFLARPLEEEGLADVSDELTILERAAQDRVPFILSGWGGDEAFSAHGLGVPASQLLQGKLVNFLRLIHVRRSIRRPGQIAHRLWANAIVPMLPDNLFHRLGPYDDLYGKGCYVAHHVNTLAPDKRVKLRGFSSDPIADIRRVLTHGHIAERMATWAAWAAPFGIEYRYPLTDRYLLEFILGLPPDMLWGDGYSRFLARSCLRGRIKGRFVKSDHANERQRLKAFRSCWSTLSAEAAKGAFDGSCEWLDMPALRTDLLRGPSGKDAADIHHFARIMPAMRVWYMAERHGVTSSARKHGA